MQEFVCFDVMNIIFSSLPQTCAIKLRILYLSSNHLLWKYFFINDESLLLAINENFVNLSCNLIIKLGFLRECWHLDICNGAREKNSKTEKNVNDDRNMLCIGRKHYFYMTQPLRHSFTYIFANDFHAFSNHSFHLINLNFN